MNGLEIFNFTLKTVPQALDLLLQKSGRCKDQVDRFFLHQANKFMLDRLRVKMKIPEEKFWVDMTDFGNTVSSTIPIALESAQNREWIHPGDTLALVGFGVGYSWAATLLQWV